MIYNITGVWEAQSLSKPVKVCQSDCVGFQSASRREGGRTGVLLQDASHGSAGVRERGSVLQCDGPPSLLPALYASRVRFDSGSKNQGGSRLLKVDQGGSRHFETFFYALRNIV